MPEFPPILQETSQEADENTTLSIDSTHTPSSPIWVGPETVEGSMNSPKRQFGGFFTVPTHSKTKEALSSPSQVLRFFQRNGLSSEKGESWSDRIKLPLEQEYQGATEDDASSHLSPRLSEPSSSLSQHITTMLNSGLRKTGFMTNSNDSNEFVSDDPDATAVAAIQLPYTPVVKNS